MDCAQDPDRNSGHKRDEASEEREINMQRNEAPKDSFQPDDEVIPSNDGNNIGYYNFRTGPTISKVGEPHLTSERMKEWKGPQILQKFREFVVSEERRTSERRTNPKFQDRTALLNDLIQFSKDFKIRTPAPPRVDTYPTRDPESREIMVEEADGAHETTRPDCGAQLDDTWVVIAPTPNDSSWIWVTSPSPD